LWLLGDLTVTKLTTVGSLTEQAQRVIERLNMAIDSRIAKAIALVFQSPSENGVAERFAGNCRRDLLDHVIILNEGHLKRLMTEYVRYYHDDRTHLGPSNQTPGGRKAELEDTGARIIAMPRMGGLHHRYHRAV
jgi:hypothetical protein